MELRKNQTKQLVDFFALSGYRKKLPLIVGGDFNEEPQNQPIAENMERDFVDMYTMTNQTNKYPEYTTFKYREKEGFVKRTIDYMFLAKNEYLKTKRVQVEEYLEPADVKVDSEIANPSINHPSDHYSIGYKVRLEKQN